MAHNLKKIIYLSLLYGIIGSSAPNKQESFYTSYIVKKGDTFSSIYQHYASFMSYSKFKEINKHLLEENGSYNRLEIGDKVMIESRKQSLKNLEKTINNRGLIWDHSSYKNENIQKENQQPYILIDLSKNKGYYHSDKYSFEFSVSYGFGGVGKKRQGDNKTPIGTFYVTEKHISKKFNRFIGISYPNISNAKKGLESKLINLNEYNNIIHQIRKKRIPPQNTALGGYIGIHGGKKIQFLNMNYNLTTLFNWTKGCIATDDRTIEKLYELVEIGTKIIIQY